MHVDRRVHAAAAPDNTGINTGHFSQACKIGDVVYIGGTLATDQKSQRVVDDSPAHSMRRAYRNLELICIEAGVELDDIVMLNAMLIDLDDLEVLNTIQAEFFSEPHPPRSTYQVAGLPHGRIELNAVAITR